MKIEITREKTRKAVIGALVVKFAELGEPCTALVAEHRATITPELRVKFESMVDEAHKKLLKRHS